MDAKTHWDKVYSTKAPREVSWYKPHLDSSLALIERAASDRAASIVDIGAGESTLVDDLVLRGYNNVTALDVSPAAIEFTRQRLGSKAEQVQWIVGDICNVELETRTYNLWHDRAVFHFLTAKEQRVAYVRQVLRAVKPGGNVILATFGPEGPTRCSGLEIVRYDATSLAKEFGQNVHAIENFTEQHGTPFGTTQEFLYCWFKLEPNAVG